MEFYWPEGLVQTKVCQASKMEEKHGKEVGEGSDLTFEIEPLEKRP